MRTFRTESIWDAEEQQWVEVYTVDGILVDMETFNDEMDREVNSPEEEMDYNDWEDEDNGEEFTDEQKADIDLVEEYADILENVELCDCGCTLRNILYEFLTKGKEIGYDIALSEIDEDEVEEENEDKEEAINNISINIESLTVNGNNANDFVKQLRNSSRLNIQL